jgi:hypothetical protein
MDVIEVYVKLCDRKNALGEVQFSTKQGALLNVWATAHNLDELDYLFKSFSPGFPIKYLPVAQLSRLSVAQLTGLPVQAGARGIASHHSENQVVPR